MLSFQVTAFIVIPMTWQRSVMSAGIILGGFLIFFGISKAGEQLLKRVDRRPRGELDTISISSRQQRGRNTGSHMNMGTLEI